MTTPADTPSIPASSEWLPVPDAATAAGVPVRSLYRWIEKKKLTTRADGTTTLVQLAAVRAVAERRATMQHAVASAVHVCTTPSFRADTGTAPVGDSGTGTPSGTKPTATTTARPEPSAKTGGNDGELAALVFGRFEDGASPVDVVRDLRLPPDKVRALHREWSDLRSAGNSGTALADRLSAIEARLNELSSILNEQVPGLECNLTDAGSRLAALERRVARIPIPSAEQFTCPACRKHGHVLASVTCGSCRAPLTVEARRQ
jgi:hypothetical protein